MFEVITLKRSSRGVNTGRNTKSTLGFSVKGPTRTNKTKTVCFFVGIDLAKKARFIKGDRVIVLKDKDSKPPMGMLKRTHQDDLNGRIIGTGGDSKNILRLAMSDSINVFPPPTKSVINLNNIVINDEGIYFDWPD